jgi:hypothetical protein
MKRLLFLFVFLLSVGGCAILNTDKAVNSISLPATQDTVLPLFSDNLAGGMPHGWAPLVILRTKKQTQYQLVTDDAKETAFAIDVMKTIVGDNNVDAQVEPTMGAEDFAFMLQEKPGCYVFIGNGEGAHREAGHGLGPCNLHNPSYDFNDDLLPIGATYWVRLAESYLEKV